MSWQVSNFILVLLRSLLYLETMLEKRTALSLLESLASSNAARIS